jgi:hypothetical protein
VVATNRQGQAKSSSQMTVQLKQESVLTETSHEHSLAKIHSLETRSSTLSKSMMEHEKILPPPRFLGPLKCTGKIKEYQQAHFETRLEPQSDSTMTITWLLNGI